MDAEQKSTGLNPAEFINSIIVEMNMANENPEKLAILKGQMEEEVSHIILNTASLYVNPIALDKIPEYYGNTKDLALIFSQIIKYSPAAQWAILDALDKFKEQMLDAYNSLKKS